MNTTVVMKQRLVLAIILLVSVLQLRAQGIMVNLKNGTNVKFSSEDVESISTYGYDSPHTGFINGYEYVDLGLPSGTLWATCNVGAIKPEDYGDYYTWGETSTKVDYDYVYHEGFLESSDIAGTNNDVAHVKWGGGWRMPTREQFQELIDNTIITQTKLNNISGILFKSKIYKTSIFLPKAGWIYERVKKDVGDRCHYWSSTHVSKSTDSYFLFNTQLSKYSFYYGKSVRPVLKNK